MSLAENAFPSPRISLYVVPKILDRLGMPFQTFRFNLFAQIQAPQLSKAVAGLCAEQAAPLFGISDLPAQSGCIRIEPTWPSQPERLFLQFSPQPGIGDLCSAPGLG